MKAQQDSRTHSAEARRQQTPASLGSLIANLARDAGALVRDETQLARTEMSEKTSQVATGIG